MKIDAEETRRGGGEEPSGVYARETNQLALPGDRREPSDRYPVLYQIVADFFKRLRRGPRESRGEVFSILSFGCSSGEEARSLASLYFNDTEALGVKRVQVYGADTNDTRLSMAEASSLSDGSANSIVFFNNNKVPLSRYGPYDIIMANSVLGRNRHGMKEGRYPFSLFERTVSSLDSVLKEGGVLVMANAVYRLHHTRESLCQRYYPIPGPSASDCNPGGRTSSRTRDPKIYPALFPNGTRIPTGATMLSECVVRRHSSFR